MSYHDYAESRALANAGRPFHALLMAAMRRADSENLAKLIDGWPEVWKELDARYNAPGGLLPTELELPQPSPSGPSLDGSFPLVPDQKPTDPDSAEAPDPNAFASSSPSPELQHCTHCGYQKPAGSRYKCCDLEWDIQPGS